VKREDFIVLVKREQESLRRFLLALCLGNRDEANDIAQETLVKAYLSSSGFSDDGKFAAWIFKIAYNTFLDHRKTVRTFVPIDNLRTEMGNEKADSSYEYEELYFALNTLSEKERTAILLYYIKGYSIKEISKIVDCKEDAVKKQLSRGREQLKQKLTIPHKDGE